MYSLLARVSSVSYQFVSRYISTIGVDYGVKPVQAHGCNIKVNFWDLSGHPEFFDIRNEFYKDTQAVRAQAKGNKPSHLSKGSARPSPSYPYACSCSRHILTKSANCCAVVFVLAFSFLIAAN